MALRLVCAFGWQTDYTRTSGIGAGKSEGTAEAIVVCVQHHAVGDAGGVVRLLPMPTGQNLADI